MRIFFLGALAANNNLVPLTMHIKNHESWLRVSQKVKNKIAGVAMTGWSRYGVYPVFKFLCFALIVCWLLIIWLLVEVRFPYVSFLVLLPRVALNYK